MSECPKVSEQGSGATRGATMLHPDKQHGRDEAARRRTATAWQRVSAAYGRVTAALGADVPDG